MDTGERMKIARNLARIRAERDMTQEALAEIIKSTAPHISDIETGKRGMSAKMVARVCKGLGITPNELYGENQEAPARDNAETGLSPDIMRLARMLQMIPEERRRDIIGKGSDEAMRILQEMLNGSRSGPDKG